MREVLERLQKDQVSHAKVLVPYADLSDKHTLAR